MEYGFIQCPPPLNSGQRSDIWARHEGPDLAGTASASYAYMAYLLFNVSKA
jgi:hypothetical protein